MPLNINSPSSSYSFKNPLPFFNSIYNILYLPIFYHLNIHLQILNYHYNNILFLFHILGHLNIHLQKLIHYFHYILFLFHLYYYNHRKYYHLYHIQFLLIFFHLNIHLQILFYHYHNILFLFHFFYHINIHLQILFDIFHYIPLFSIFNPI